MIESWRPLIGPTLYENGSGNELTKLHNAVGLINYFEARESDEFDSPERFHAWANLDAETFAILRGMALAGKLPKTMRLHAYGMNYGWEPDGSGKVWDVKAHKNAPIGEINFETDLVKGPESVWVDNDAGFAVPPPTPESIELAVMRGIATAVEQVNARLGWVIGLIILTVAVVFFR